MGGSSRGRTHGDWLALLLVDAVHLEHARVVVRAVASSAARDDVGRELESAADVVAAGLRNDANPAARLVNREVLSDGLAEDCSDLLKVVVLEATADVEEFKVVTDFLADIERPAGSADGVAKERRVLAAAAAVEGNAHNVDVELLGAAQQAADLAQRRSELESETAQTARVVREDAENHARGRVVLLDLGELVGVVKGHAVDAALGRVPDERRGLARVGVDDARRRDAARERHDCRDLGLRRAVEAESEGSHEAEDVRVRVRLDGEEGVHSLAELAHPAQVLAVDFGEVGDEERVLAVRLAVLEVDRLERGSEVVDDRTRVHGRQRGQLGGRREGRAAERPRARREGRLAHGRRRVGRRDVRGRRDHRRVLGRRGGGERELLEEITARQRRAGERVEGRFVRDERLRRRDRDRGHCFRFEGLLRDAREDRSGGYWKVQGSGIRRD